MSLSSYLFSSTTTSSAVSAEVLGALGSSHESSSTSMAFLVGKRGWSILALFAFSQDDISCSLAELDRIIFVTLVLTVLVVMLTLEWLPLAFLLHPSKDIPFFLAF